MLIDDRMIEYLLSIGVDPTPFIHGMPQPDDPMGATYLGPRFQGPDADFMRGSEVKNFMQLQSDPAFIANLGDGPGGFRDQDFQPTVEYDPVRQPGRETIQWALQSGDPVTQLIAEVIAEGGSELQAEAVIRDIVQDPTNDLHEVVMRYMPTYQDQITGDQLLDWRRLADMTTSLRKDVLGDPMGDMIDPNTGMAYSMTETPSAAAEYFQRAGLPLPTERYGMEQFRSPEEMAFTEQNRAAIPGVMDREQDALGKTKAIQEAMMRTQLGSDDPGRQLIDMATSPTGVTLGVDGVGSLSEGRDRSNRQGRSAVAGARGGTDLFEWLGSINQPSREGGGRRRGRQRTPSGETSTLAPGTGPLAPSAGSLAPSGPRSSPWGRARDSLADLPQQQLRQARSEAGALGNERIHRQLGLNEFRGGQSSAMDIMKNYALQQSGRTPLNDALHARRQAMARFGLQV